MKILITGSEGFIGSHLSERLIKSGYSVSCFVQYNSFGNLGWIDTFSKKIKNQLIFFRVI